MANEELTYLTGRAAEERRLAASLPEGPAAIVHGQMAELYEKAVREKMASIRSPALPDGRNNIQFVCRAPFPGTTQA